ncbi:MAG: hypothetical protein NWF07_13725 [Candidatus Bathyarchaeota archaeon]|nr:hypothetical protein [Candidatus Bathyarchaeota archaeon]
MEIVLAIGRIAIFMVCLMGAIGGLYATTEGIWEVLWRNIWSERREGKTHWKYSLISFLWSAICFTIFALSGITTIALYIADWIWPV